MTVSADTVPVVAAVVRRGDDLLVALRPKDKRHAGKWEFPGGKIQEGESIADAIGRELREELAVRVTHVGETLFTVTDPGSEFEIHFVEAEIAGIPRPLEHEEFRWVDRSALRGMPLAPADERFVTEALGAVAEHR